MCCSNETKMIRTVVNCCAARFRWKTAFQKPFRILNNYLLARVLRILSPGKTYKRQYRQNPIQSTETRLCSVLKYIMKMIPIMISNNTPVDNFGNCSDCNHLVWYLGVVLFSVRIGQYLGYTKIIFSPILNTRTSIFNNIFFFPFFTFFESTAASSSSGTEFEWFILRTLLLNTQKSGIANTVLIKSLTRPKTSWPIDSHPFSSLGFRSVSFHFRPGP